jgi:hypothetical protein
MLAVKQNMLMVGGHRYVTLAALCSDSRTARLLVLLSSGLSMLLATLIIAYAATATGGYLWPTSAFYAIAYTACAVGTSRNSSGAAAGAGALYVSMHHSLCGDAHFAAHLAACCIFALGVVGTFFLGAQRTRDPRPTLADRA